VPPDSIARLRPAAMQRGQQGVSTEAKGPIYIGPDAPHAHDPHFQKRALGGAKLPAEIFQRRPGVFCWKLFIGAAVFALGAWLALLPGFAGQALGVLLMGLMGAHFIELQHECLHNHAFATNIANRLAGALLGLPMLVSHSHYQQRHFDHHRLCGSENNKEFFAYDHSHLVGPVSCLASMLKTSVRRWFAVLRDMRQSCFGGSLLKQAIQEEYRLYLLVVASVVTFCLLKGTAAPLRLWLAVLLVSDIAHFLIELPEHYGLDTQRNADPMANTRTIRGSWLSRWYTNCNNLHTAHHFHQGVPMCNLRWLHTIIEGQIRPEAIEDNYAGFYWRVVTGGIKFDPKKSCMM